MQVPLKLETLDIAVIALFVAAILALGFSARVRDHSLLQYLAAGRNLSLPAFVGTLVSTWYGGIMAIGDSVKAFGFGTFLLMGVPYYVFAVIYALVLAPRVRAADQISIPERFSTQWGKASGLIGAALVFLLAVPAAHVLMLGTLVKLFTGWPILPGVVVGTALGTLFLYRGGLLADVRAGMLAFVMMYVGFGVILVWCLVHHPLIPTLSTIDPSLKHWDGGGGGLLFVSYFILGAWTLVDPGFHQRVSSARSPELGRKGVLICVVAWMVFDLLSMTTALYALAILKPIPEGLSFFPILASQVLPPGLRAVFLCGILGAVLSAAVGYTLVAGATFGREFVQRLRPSMTDDQTKTWVRIGLFVTCVTAATLAVSVDNVVVDLWYAYSGAIVGALLIPMLASYVPSKRLFTSPKWVNASMIGAFLVSFSWMIYGKRTGNPFLEVYVSGSRFTLGTVIPGIAVSGLILLIGHVERAQTQRRTTDDR